jgi:hypothetical protein
VLREASGPRRARMEALRRPAQEHEKEVAV